MNQTFSDVCRKFYQEFRDGKGLRKADLYNEQDIIKKALIHYFQGTPEKDKLFLESDVISDKWLISNLKKEGFYLYLFKEDRLFNDTLLISLSPLKKETRYDTKCFEYDSNFLFKNRNNRVISYCQKGMREL